METSYMSTLVLGTQGMFLDVTEPEDDDEDILDEAETIKFYFETLLKKNPLIVKEVSKVKLDLSLLLYLFFVFYLFVCFIWDRVLLYGLRRPTSASWLQAYVMPGSCSRL